MVSVSAWLHLSMHHQGSSCSVRPSLWTDTGPRTWLEESDGCVDVELPGGQAELPGSVDRWAEGFSLKSAL